MKINSELKKLARGLSKNKQQIKNINEYLYEVLLEWHHPDETVHRDTQLYVKDLKEFFEELSSDKNDIINHIESLNYLCSCCEIEVFSNSLHDVMMCYLKYSNEIGNEPLGKYFNNYKYLRNFLSELNVIERELSIPKRVVVVLD
ncbi:MAG: hypothetical protein JKY69_03575 [Flavobacteriaceae bacterium]|nr:hypothetical protein [Flavobacteriaceae bacterium]MBL4905791.1 hypothetical protein [Flavobacteriaceae bacterium]